MPQGEAVNPDGCLSFPITLLLMLLSFITQSKQQIYHHCHSSFHIQSEWWNIFCTIHRSISHHYHRYVGISIDQCIKHQVPICAALFKIHTGNAHLVFILTNTEKLQFYKHFLHHLKMMFTLPPCCITVYFNFKNV